MRLEYDPEADAVYIYLREGVPFAFTHDVDDARNIDYGPDNLPIGVEFPGVSQGVDLTGLPQSAYSSSVIIRWTLSSILLRNPMSVLLLPGLC
jgi:uncharacterized protein YuzE